MFTCNIVRHTHGPTVEAEIKRRLNELMDHDGSLRGLESVATIADGVRRREPHLVLSSVLRDAICIHVPMLNDVPNVRGYRSFEVTIKPPAGIVIGSFCEVVRNCLARHRAFVDNHAPPDVDDALSKTTQAQHVLGTTAAFTERTSETKPSRLAKTLLAIYKRNTTAKKPEAVTKIAIEVTGDTRHQTAVRKTIEDMENQGYLNRSGKEGLVIIYGLTQSAAEIIRQEPGEEINLDDVPSFTAEPDAPTPPELTFEEALQKFLEQKGKMEEMVACAPSLRAEIEQLEAALNEKRTRLKAIKEVELKLERLARQFASLLC